MCKVELSIALLSIGGLSINFSARQIVYPQLCRHLAPMPKSITLQLPVGSKFALTVPYSMPVQGAALNCCTAFSLTLVPAYEHDVILLANA